MAIDFLGKAIAAQPRTVAALKAQTTQMATARAALIQTTATQNNITPAQAEAKLNSDADARYKAAVASQSKSPLAAIGGAIAGPIQSAISQTPIAPFAGAIGSLAQGDFRGAAANAASAGVELALQATPLGDVPVLGQIAETQAGNFVKNMIQGQPAGQAANQAAAGAFNSLAGAAVAMAGAALPQAPNAGPNTSDLPPNVAQAIKSSELQTQAVIKPYGKVFLTRSAWEAWASDPKTCGGTIGFPK